MFKRKKRDTVLSGQRDDDYTRSWFEDDAEWEHLQAMTRRSKDTERISGSNVKQADNAFDNPADEPLKKVEVSIKFRLPQISVRWPDVLRRSGKWLRSRTTTQKLAITGSLLLLTGIVVGFAILDRNDYRDAAVAGSQEAARTPEDPLPKEDLPFQILYPGNKDKQSVGEVVRISPDGNEPVYAYTDKISEVPIQVSQQKIPKAFEDNPSGQLEKTAKDFQANQVFSVDSVRVYHGKSSSGIQSLIFIKGNLLIFIKSSSELSQDIWAAYISAMHS